MRPTVIDTLKFANRLKQAGVETGQAEAMSLALNDELTEGLATKTDLDDAVSKLGSRIDDLDAKFEVRFAEVEARFTGQDGKFESIDARFEAIDARFESIDARFESIDARFESIDARFDAMDTKFEALDTRFSAVDTQFDALRSQNRYVFLVLALIAGLGLYNATAPHLLGHSVGQVGQAPPTEPIRSAPAGQAPMAETKATTKFGA